MALGPEKRFQLRTQTMTRAEAEATEIDVGLREYMLKVYNYMASGLALTGIVAYLTASSPTLMQLIFGTPLAYVAMFLPLVGFLFIPSLIQRKDFRVAQIAFWGFAGALGISYSVILLVYTDDSIARVFFITAGMFAGMSLFGYTTKRDLTGLGGFAVMGTWGILIAMMVNWFLQSPALYFVISVIGVLVAVGLTAYDTQKIKEMYLESDSSEVMGKKAILGALRLYFDFLYLFLMLLRLFGSRR